MREVSYYYKIFFVLLKYLIEVFLKSVICIFLFYVWIGKLFGVFNSKI